MFYHISSTKGITYLEPRVSTHKKSWVYALTNPNIGLIFAGRDDLGNKADDSFTKFGVTEDNIPEVFELFEGCLDNILNNKDCYIYILEDSGFKRNQTSWAPEWVSEHKTKVIDSIYIPDILEEIKELNRQGKYVIHYYENTESYNNFVRERIMQYLDNTSQEGWINISLIHNYEEIVKDFVKENINNNYRKDFENLTSRQLQQIFYNLDNDNYCGRFIRKELFYLYPKESIDWINKKYEKAKSLKNEQNKILNEV